MIKKILTQLPHYAQDVAKSMEIILQNNSMNYFTEQDLYGIALTTGYALKNESLLNQIRAEAKNFLGNEEATACKIAVSSISMLNSYYKSVHKLNFSNQIKPSFALDKLEKHSIDEKTFLIYCLTTSIINNCEFSILSYVEKLKNHAFSDEAINFIAEITSTLKAISNILEIERMRSYDFLIRDESI